MPKVPRFFPALMVRLRMVSSLPSEKPERRAASLSRSTTWILSTSSAGRFLSATLGSPSKKRLPSTMICETVLPLMVTCPCSLIVAPGSFLTSSSTASPCCVV